MWFIHKLEIYIVLLFSSTGIKGTELFNIVKECVKQLVHASLKHVAITCDQGTQSRKMFSLFGANEDKPSAKINVQTLIFIYDIPHLIKRGLGQ